MGCGGNSKHCYPGALGTVNVDILKPNVEIGNFVQADGHRLPFKDRTFDKVVSHEVIEHVENPTRLVGEMHRVLKCGGKLEVSTPNPTQWRSLLRLLFHRKVTVFKDHITCWTRPELENLFRKVGFSHVKASYIVFKDRQRFESWKHRHVDKVVHMLSLTKSLTGSSIVMEGTKT